MYSGLQGDEVNWRQGLLALSITTPPPTVVSPSTTSPPSIVPHSSVSSPTAFPPAEQQMTALSITNPLPPVVSPSMTTLPTDILPSVTTPLGVVSQQPSTSSTISSPQSDAPLSRTSAQVDPSTLCRCRTRCHSSKSCFCKKQIVPCTIECHPGHSCTNCKASTMEETVDLTMETNSDVIVEKLVEPTVLSSEQRSILCTNGWLDDMLINLGQSMLKAKYQHTGISGLQSVVLAEKFALAPKPDEFLLILNVNNNHWILISTIQGRGNHSGYPGHGPQARAREIVLNMSTFASLALFYTKSIPAHQGRISLCRVSYR